MDGARARVQCACGMRGFEDRYWWSRDGLRLHYREYAGPTGGLPVLCLHGLTRNARDFETLAPRIAATGRRVLCPTLRGRGESAYARDSMTYAPLTYLSDLDALIAAIGIERAVIVGTSLGGLLTMLIAATHPGFVAGAVLNDIGPAIDPRGLDRIRGYVGKGGGWPSWLHAARDLMAANADVYPRWSIEDFLLFAKRVGRVGEGGRIIFDYDPRIADPFRLPGGEAAGDMWLAFAALEGVPVLSIRGALSDLFAGETQAEMARRLPGLETLVVEAVGHAPTLDEPECVAAVERLLDAAG